MLAHEVDRRQGQLSLAQIARLLIVEVDGCLFHLGYLLLAVANLGHLLVQSRVVLVYPLLLRFQVLKEKLLDDTEPQVRIAFEDLKDKQRRQDVSLPDLLADPVHFYLDFH